MQEPELQVVQRRERKVKGKPVTKRRRLGEEMVLYDTGDDGDDDQDLADDGSRDKEAGSL
jgi:hypothetical protein